MRYGISTHLYHAERLTRAHLQELASFGFSDIELFATRSHVDYHDASAIETVASWFRDLNLRLHSIHAPIMERFSKGDRWEGRTFSLASADTGRRREAVEEATRALEFARRVPVDVLVIHLGMPAGHAGPGDNARDAALRSVEELHAAAGAVNVRLAIEVIPNDLSTSERLVRFVEDDVAQTGAGICLDFGHAFLQGDVVDAVETVSGHLVSTHVHDNDGRADRHLTPFDGGINWATALMAVQKIGYEGTLLFEVADTSTPREVLQRTRHVRSRFEQMLI
jgi:sugar phosphate isomerase/epimerase